MRVLVVDSDKSSVAIMIQGFQNAGHVTEQADNARDGLFMAASERFDAMVLERVLPNGVDGLTVLGTLRSQQNAIPVLILSSMATVEARVEGLKAGCDDYLPKPFDVVELLARVESLNRRDRGEPRSAKLAVEDLELDMITRSVRRAGQPIELTPREFLLLQFLMRHAGQVVTRTMLLEGVWHYDFFPQTNLVDAHISCLRQKVDKPFPTGLIHTVRGAGYMMDGPRPATLRRPDRVHRPMTVYHLAATWCGWAARGTDFGDRTLGTVSASGGLRVDRTRVLDKAPWP